MTRQISQLASRFALALLAIGLGAADLQARDWWLRYPPKDVQRMHESGYPQYVRKRAEMTYDEDYGAYYVGGGQAFYRRGEPRYTHEGTFGVDYNPWFSRVSLLWSHGLKHQGGRGHYNSNHKSPPFINARLRFEGEHGHH